MMIPISQTTYGDHDTAVRKEERETRRRRRTLGLCAQCQQPVEIDGEHLRLYRLAWHLECALAAGGPAAELPPLN